MTVATATRMHCRVWAYGSGEWTVELTGIGYPKALYIDGARLAELILNDGYALDDPGHLVDLYGPAALREEFQSAAALDADSAGYGYRDGGPDTGDYGVMVATLGEEVE
jgi:hypothetical protein